MNSRRAFGVEYQFCVACTLHPPLAFKHCMFLSNSLIVNKDLRVFAFYLTSNSLNLNQSNRFTKRVVSDNPNHFILTKLSSL